MAPNALKKLIAEQNSRLAEMQAANTRLRAKARDTFSRNMVASRITALDGTMEKARSTHVIISRADAERDPYIVDNVFERIQEVCEDTLDYLSNLRSESETMEQPTLPIGLPAFSTPIASDGRPAKLPRLDLPTFSGNNGEWENFHDLFTTLVHNAPNLADATKLQYLKTCLKGAAADLVKNVTTTNENYDKTWKAVQKRYNNTRWIIGSHVNALLNLPFLKNASAVELRSFADEVQRIVRALTSLKLPIEHWDVWLVIVVASRLDDDSRMFWECEVSEREHLLKSSMDTDALNANPLSCFPKFSDLSSFLEKRVQSLQMFAAEAGKGGKKPATSSKPVPGSRRILQASSARNSAEGKYKCMIWSGAHSLHKCDKFLAMTPSERHGEVGRLQLCYRCFGRHRVVNCKSKFRCAECKKGHNSLLHSEGPSSFIPGNKGAIKPVKPREAKPSTSTGINIHTANVAPRKYTVLLATAQLTLVGMHGAQTRMRALLDQGSETSFVSESIAKLLGLQRRRVDIPLTGLGTKSVGTARSVTQLELRSLTDSSFQIRTEALVLQKLTSRLPARCATELDLGMFEGLELADPQFYISDSVDVILGADIYGQLLRSGLRKFPSSPLIAQETALGWVISGPVQTGGSWRAETSSRSALQMLHCATDTELNGSLQRFWILEELPPVIASLQPADEACENLFRESHIRNSEGRFVVRLPVSQETPVVASETRRMAMGSLAHMQRRFARDHKLALAYREFMTIYEELGHMERVPASDLDNPRAWYLPHHAVIRSSPSDWKIRVVFDASRKTREGQCLNDFLMSGPALQRDLSLILLNWRQYRYVFTADIVKMFRQISVASEDRDLQRIVWAPNSSDTPVDYRLTTVTYGTACAPYLAIRTLLQLAEDERNRFPLGARCLTDNTYVDDTFAGANNLSVAVRTREELVAILRTDGIELDKWSANHSDLLPPRMSRSQSEESRQIGADESVKALGIHWNPREDEFKFTTLDLKDLAGASTKRAVLSNIARLFDPLGWLAPITVIAKILMQDLWILKTGWDDSLPAEVRERWLDYCSSRSALPNLSINR